MDNEILNAKLAERELKIEHLKQVFEDGTISTEEYYEFLAKLMTDTFKEEN